MEWLGQAWTHWRQCFSRPNRIYSFHLEPKQHPRCRHVARVPARLWGRQCRRLPHRQEWSTRNTEGDACLCPPNKASRQAKLCWSKWDGSYVFLRTCKAAPAAKSTWWSPLENLHSPEARGLSYPSRRAGPDPGRAGADPGRAGPGAGPEEEGYGSTPKSHRCGGDHRLSVDSFSPHRLDAHLPHTRVLSFLRPCACPCACPSRPACEHTSKTDASGVSSNTEHSEIVESISIPFLKAKMDDEQKYVTMTLLQVFLWRRGRL